MKRQFKPILITVLVLCVLLSCLGASAQTGGATLSAEIGYDGIMTYLASIPLRVNIKNEGADFTGVLSVDMEISSTEYDRYECPVTVASGAEVNVTMQVTAQRKQTSYRIQLKNGENVIAETTVAPVQVLAPSTLMVGVLSGSAKALSYMSISSANDVLLRDEVWQTVALSADTFPASEDAMDFFHMIVVDGVDMNTLSEAQKTAFTRWLNAGGIVIVGGGAQSAKAFPYFQAMTGVTAGAPVSSETLCDTLQNYLAQMSLTVYTPNPDAPKDAQAMLTPLSGGNTLLTAPDGTALISRTVVTKGVVYQTAFSLSEKPLSSWDGMQCFWQRVLLDSDSTLYQNLVRSLNNYYYNAGNTADSGILQNIPIKNDTSLLPAVLLIVLFILAAGFGGYFLLKKMDKREWLWAVIPVSAIIFSLVIWAFSGTVTLNKPVAVSYSVISVQDGIATVKTAASVATQQKSTVTVSMENGSAVHPSQDSYIYYDDDNTTVTDKKLRFIRTTGDVPSVTYPEASPWTIRSFYTDETVLSLPVSASIWWETDGLHGKVKNDSGITLKKGWILTNVGYCTVPELAGGQEYEFAILRNSAKSARDDTYKDGEMSNHSSSSIVSVKYAAIFPEYQGVTDYNKQQSLLTNEERTRRESINTLVSNALPADDYYSATYQYVTFSDDVKPAQVLVNGAPAPRSASESVICVPCDYSPVSASGIVNYPAGYLTASAGAINVYGQPYDTATSINEYIYFHYDVPAVLHYQLNELKDCTISTVTLSATWTTQNVTVKVYNPISTLWEEVGQNVQFPISLNAKQFKNYIDENGNFYLSFESQGGANNQGEVDHPLLAVEGSKK